MSAPAANLSQNNVVFNQVLNTIGELGNRAIDTGVVVPGILGGLGGWLAGIGTSPGFVQGVASGLLYSCALSPLGSYISHQPTEGDGKISNSARGFLYTVGVVAQFAIPILITSHAAPFFAPILQSYVPMLFWSTPVAYSAMRGMLVNVLPAITQYSIKALREENKRPINQM